MRAPAILGIGALPVQRHLPCSVQDAATRVALDAIADSGVAPRDVDGLFVSPPALGGRPWMLWSCSLANHLGLATRAQMAIECGGMTAGLALKSAVDAIRLGRCRAALVVAMDQRLEPGPDLGRAVEDAVPALIGLYGATHGVYGLRAPVPYYAMSAQRYFHEYGASREDLARLAVLLRSHASKNPRAEHRKPLTFEEAMASRSICPPLTLHDCSSFSSGAAAVVVASDDVVGSSKHRRVFVTGIGEHHEADHFAPERGPLTTYASAVGAAAAAYAEAGRSAEEVDVAEVYGAFSATELMLYEDLGFFAKGGAPRALLEGRTSGEGRTFMSPSGGRLSLGHPACATPLLAAVELTEQLRGTARGHQVRANVALLHAEHGMVNGSLVAILEGA